MIHKSLWQEGRKQLPLLLLLVGAGLFVGAAAIAQAYTFAILVDGVFIDGHKIADLAGWLYCLVAAMAARAAGVWLLETAGTKLALAIKTDLRERLYTHIVDLGPVYAGGERAGELVNLLGEGVESLDAYFSRYLPQLAVTVLLPIGVLAAVFPFDATAALIMLFTAPLIPLLLVLIGRWAGELHKKRWQVLSNLSGHFLDVLRGLTTLKLFGRSREQISIIFGFSEAFRRTTMGVLRVAFLSALTLELLSTISVALVAVTIGLKLLYGGIAFREAFFILLLAPEFYQPFRLLGGHFHAGAAAAAAAERIFGILAVPLPPATFGDKPLDTSGGVTVAFVGVSYTYPGREEPALRDVSFTLLSGSRLALVGPSGAGKTTVINLLLGFAAPDRGTIRVNGRDLREVRREDWLRQVAYIPQFPHIFAGTVADNIRLGAEEGAEEALKAAAVAAEAHEFISRLPQGYHTPIGEGGRPLSGGEAQRIAIARAFYRQAPLIILDEATSALDLRTEKAVQVALTRLFIGRTVLTVAHRLNTVEAADLIVVLDDGLVAEKGRHGELASGMGLYSRLIAAYRGGP